MATEKKILVNLLNYMFDNNIEPWNNQTNQKTVNDYLASNSYLSLQLVSKSLLPESVTINSATSKEGFNFTDYEYREWLKSDIDNLDDFLEQELC